MLFKTKPKIRHTQPLETPEYDADLLSKDKNKQKEAVRRYLAERIRNDWKFEWPLRPEDNSSEPSHHLDDDEAVPPPAADTEGAGLAGPRPATNGEGTAALTPETLSPPTDATDAKAVPISGNNNFEVVQDGDDDEAVRDSGDEADSESGDDVESVYSTVSEDSTHFQPRLEWSSELSDDEPVPSSPYRFESPDSVGAAIRASTQAKKDKRRRAARDETKWNEGVACFEARRNAWTGARVVRVRKKPASPGPNFSPLSPRRFFFRNSVPNSPTTASTTPLSPTVSTTPQATAHPAQGHHHRPSGDASLTLSDSSDPYSTSISKPTTKSSTSPPPSPHPVEILLPLAPPLLPAANPMRAGITPSMYLPLYDKIIVNGLAPSCPVNLSDMLRACVCGWKRDGEWPPRMAVQEAPAGKKRRKRYEDGGRGSVGSIGGSIGRRMSFGFLGVMKEPDHKEHKAEHKEGEDHGKGIRKSLQRVLGIGNGHHGGPTEEGHHTPHPMAKI